MTVGGRELDHKLHLRSRVQALEYERAVDRIVSDGARRVLDWGCGWGQVSALMVERGLDVCAFDYRPHSEGSEPASSGPQPLELFPAISACIERDDPVALPYADGSFDAVLSMGVLEHVARPDDSLEEVKRVLVEGGTFYVFKLPNRFSYTERIGRLGGRYWHGMLPDDRLYTLRSAVDLLRRHGFEVREARRANMLPLNRVAGRSPRTARAWWAANRALTRMAGVNLLATNVEVIATAPRRRA